MPLATLGAVALSIAAEISSGPLAFVTSREGSSSKISSSVCYAHVQRAHGPISRCGRHAMAKNALFMTLMAGAE